MHGDAVSACSVGASALTHVASVPYSSDAQYGLSGSAASGALLAANCRRRALIIHDQDNASTPSFSYTLAWYELSTPSRIIGVMSGAEFDRQGMAMLLTPIDLTGITLGVVQLPFDRTRGLDDFHGLVYDTSADAGDGTAGLPADIVPQEFQEIITGQLDGPLDEQMLWEFRLNFLAGTVNDWAADQLRAVVMMHRPLADGSGVNPITNMLQFQFAGSRGFDTPVPEPEVLTAGPENEINSFEFTIAAGVDLPAVTFFTPEDASEVNRACRTILAGCFLESKTATSGLSIIAFGVPLVDSYDLSFPPQAIAPSTWGQVLSPIGDIDVIVIRTGGFVAHGWQSGDAGWDVLTQLIDTSDPDTAPYGNYRGEFTESIVDEINTFRTQAGGSAKIGPPVLLVLTHFSGAGRSLAEAELILATMKAAIIWSLNSATPRPTGVTNTEHKVLYNCAAVFPWHDVTPEQILTGQGAAQYIRTNGLAVRGTWAPATVYLAGDVIVREEAADYLRSNHGWYVCVAGGGHTSDVSGVDGPPEDPDQTRWEAVDFRLNDNGKAREVAAVWAEIATGEEQAALAQA